MNHVPTTRREHAEDEEQPPTPDADLLQALEYMLQQQLDIPDVNPSITAPIAAPVENTPVAFRMLSGLRAPKIVSLEQPKIIFVKVSTLSKQTSER